MWLAVRGLGPGRMLRSRGKFMASYKTQWHASNTEGKRNALWSYIVLADTIAKTLTWLWFQLFFFESKFSELAHLSLQSPLKAYPCLWPTCPLVYGMLWSSQLLSIAKVTLVLQTLNQPFLWRNLLSSLVGDFSLWYVASLQTSKESHNYFPVA